MATHVRKNITLPRALDNQVRAAARKRGTSQSRLIAHLVEMGLAAEEKQIDRLLAFAGVLDATPARRLQCSVSLRRPQTSLMYERRHTSLIGGLWSSSRSMSTRLSHGLTPSFFSAPMTTAA